MRWKYPLLLLLPVVADRNPGAEFLYLCGPPIFERVQKVPKEAGDKADGIHAGSVG